MGMMCLGQFVFELKSAPYQSLQRQMGWRHPSNARVGLRPARQFIGPDDESITVSGVLLPELAGNFLSLDELRDMADDGEAYVLVDGRGQLYGRWVIESLDETQTVFFRDGVPRKIEFSLALKRVDDGDSDLLDEETETARRLVVEKDGKPKEDAKAGDEETVEEETAYSDDGAYSGRPVTGMF